MLLGLPLGVLRVKVRYNEHKHAAARAQCTYKTRTQRACYALRQPTSPACTQPRMRAPGLARTRTYTTNTAPPFPRVTATHARQTHQRAYLPTHQHTYPPPQKAHKSFVHSNARPYTRNAYVINQRVRGRVRHIRCFQCLYTKANHKSQVQTHTKRTLNAPSLYLTHPPKRVRIHAQRAH